MSNPGPLAALVYGFILIVLLSVSLILYSIGGNGANLLI